MRFLLLAGLALAPLPLTEMSILVPPGHDYSQADVAYTGECIVATLNGFSMENPQLHMGWIPAGTAKGTAEDYLFKYGSRAQACNHATNNLERAIVQALGKNNV